MFGHGGALATISKDDWQGVRIIYSLYHIIALQAILQVDDTLETTSAIHITAILVTQGARLNEI